MKWAFFFLFSFFPAQSGSWVQHQQTWSSHSFNLLVVNTTQSLYLDIYLFIYFILYTQFFQKKKKCRHRGASYGSVSPSGANKTGFSPCYVVYAALFLPVTHHRLITLLQVFLCAYDSRVLFMNYARGGCLCPWVKLYNGVRQRMYGVYVDICLCVHDAYGAENVCEREKEKEREKERER